MNEAGLPVNEAGVGAAEVRRGAGWFELDDRALIVAEGADRVRWADGMLSNDIAGLEPGPTRSGCEALLLTPQGRIVSDLHVWCREEALWLELPGAAAGPVAERLGKFIVSEDVSLRDVSSAWRRFALEGPGSPAWLAELCGEEPVLGPDCGALLELGGTPVGVCAWGWSGEPAFQIFAPASEAGGVAQALESSTGSGGRVRGDARVLEVLRIEAGRPRLGAELGLDVLPGELGSALRGVSDSKGCYTGQEIVARMAARDAAAHRLLGVAIGSGADEGLPPVGAEIRSGEEPVGGAQQRVPLGAGGCHRAGLRQAGPRPARCGGVGGPLDRASPGAALRGARRALSGGRAALVVMAKRPRPGAVKTRLCPPLSPREAASLYSAMLADVMATSAEAAERAGAELWLVVHPPAAVGALAARFPACDEVRPQRGADLGARMGHAVAAALGAGFERVLLRGSDSPAIGTDALLSGLEALRQVDLAVGPDSDGGYAWIALRGKLPEGLFAHPMSTGMVLRDTLGRAASAGLCWRELEPQLDLDSAADLEELGVLRRRGGAAACPRTLAVLDQAGLWSRL